MYTRERRSPDPWFQPTQLFLGIFDISSMDSSGRPIKFLDLVRERIRLRHLSYTTEKSYIAWIRRFIIFHGKIHPKEMGEEHIVAFLSDLAVRRNCSPGTQNQALNALVFLFRHVLNRDVGEFKGIMWSRRKRRAPEVMTREEVASVLRELRYHPQKWLIGCLMYGCGLRLSEALHIRVKDIDFGQGFIAIRDAKGNKDRIVPLPKRLVGPLRKQLSVAEGIHRNDIQAGYGRVSLPFALELPP